MNIDQNITDINSGGNMEGKETRFGIFGSVLWTVATTATSNGAVNSMLDSYMPLAGLIPLFNLLVGEIIYGGVGCGLYGILIYVFITVFIAGLMVGRTPEYLGKKIETRGNEALRHRDVDLSRRACWVSALSACCRPTAPNR